MKCYIEGESVRLTGKGWEIRHYLRGIAATAPCKMTLADWLDRRNTKIIDSRKPSARWQ